MAPMMTWRMAEAIRAGRPLIMMAEIDHPDGLARFWTGIGTLDYNGYQWTGAGALGEVGPITYTIDLTVQDVVFSVKGLSPTDVDRLSSSIRGYYGTVWRACLDEFGQVIADPFRISKVIFDTQTHTVGEDGKASISIVGHTAFFNLARRVDQVWSPQSQKRLFPTDTGMDSIPSLQNKELQWTKT